MSQPPDLTATYICRACTQTRTGVRLGDMCPEDGHALLPEAVYHEHIDDELLGEYLADKYAIVGFIGRGGLGTVYRAVQHPVRRTVAIKVIKPRLNEGLDLKRRFQREARAVARLEHPSVVTLYDYGIDEARDLLYMVMELCEGRELRAVLDADAPLEPQRALGMLDQLLDALQQAHGRGLVHRDLKPENLIIREKDGRELVKVLDFGIAKLNKTPEDEAATVLTRDGSILGTPAYLAPEQAMAKEVESRTDLYAVGVLAYEMLTGVRPFRGASAFQLLTAHCNAPVPPMDPKLEVPAALEMAVRKALSKAIVDRYSDASAMAKALHDALDHGIAPEGEGVGMTGWGVLSTAPIPGLGGPLADTVDGRPGRASSEIGTVSLPDVDPESRGHRGLFIGAAAAMFIAVGGALLAFGPAGSGDGAAAARLDAGLAVGGADPQGGSKAVSIKDAGSTKDAAPTPKDAAPIPKDAAPTPKDAATPVKVVVAKRPAGARGKRSGRKTSPRRPRPIRVRKTARNNCAAQMAIIRRSSAGGSLAKGSGLCIKIMTLYRRDRGHRCEAGFTGLGGLEQYCQ